MKNLKRLRVQRKLSQRDVAGLVGVSTSTVANWEAGAFWPSVERLLLLADAFAVSTDFFLDRAGVPANAHRPLTVPKRLSIEQVNPR